MSIAVLAWGSLVWNRGDLAIATAFQANGPLLSIEFSRVSGNGRLTLVIDEENGASCRTCMAVSALPSLKAAIENLRLREGMPSVKGVGVIDRLTNQRSAKAIERHPDAVEAIDAWAAANGYDAAIWTALASNFHESDKAAEPFSVEAAIRYLEALDAPKLAAALDYIRSAPPEVQTPVRAAVNARWPQG